MKVSGTAQPTYMWMKKEKYRIQEGKKAQISSKQVQKSDKLYGEMFWSTASDDPDGATSQNASIWSRD